MTQRVASSDPMPREEAVPALDEPVPSGGFRGEGRSGPGLYRDLDSAVSTAMTACGLGLVQQADLPVVSSARSAGQRVYQFVTMRDTPVWLRVTWGGVGGGASGEAALGEVVAGRTAQVFAWHAHAGRIGDRAFESRLMSVVTSRLAELERQERRRR